MKPEPGGPGCTPPGPGDLQSARISAPSLREAGVFGWWRLDFDQRESEY